MIGALALFSVTTRGAVGEPAIAAVSLCCSAVQGECASMANAFAKTAGMGAPATSSAVPTTALGLAIASTVTGTAAFQRDQNGKFSNPTDCC